MRMEITVRLFATLRQQAGWAEKLVEVDEGSTLRDLMTLLEETVAGLALTNRAVYAAVNREYAAPEQALHDRDEVALFPPVSGGAGGLNASSEI